MFRFLLYLVLTVVVAEGVSKTSRSSGCGGSVTLQTYQSVAFTSPNYPFSYPGPTSCYWVAQAPPKTVIRLQCQNFDVYSSPYCWVDHLLVSQRGDLALRNPTYFCGTGVINTIINTNLFVAAFYSAFKVLPVNTGFMCTVTAVRYSVPNPPTAAPPQTVVPPLTNQCGLKDASRIVGGKETVVNEWPWQAAIRNHQLNSLFCGGTLIAEEWVVTAAHCVVSYPRDQLEVTLGDHRRNPNSNTAYTARTRVDEVIIHKDYDNQTVNNDIALLKLSTAVEYNYGVRPICLPCSVTQDKLKGQNGTVTGWGTTSSGGPSSQVLQEVVLPMLTTDECQTYLGNVVTSNMFCTYLHGKDACQGDSGGPLVWEGQQKQHYLVGLVSWGYGCAGKGQPGVYVKVINYLGWIKEKTGISFCSA